MIGIMSNQITDNLFNQNRVLKGPRSAGSSCVDGFHSNCDFALRSEAGDGVLGLLCHLRIGHNPVIGYRQQTEGLV